jgi:sphingosine kinase
MTDPVNTSAAAAETSWPTEDAELAKLFVPREWPRSDESKRQRCCRILFDASRKLLKVVDDENSILDLINPADIIGCELEIKLVDETNPSKALATSKGSENPEAGTFDNTPKSLIPVDSHAKAVLTIYAYPKRDLSQSSTWLSWCGFGGKNDAPNPNPPSATGPFGNRQARHRTFQVAPAEDLVHINALVRGIRQASGLPARPRKLLVLVNLKSGTGTGQQVLDQTVRPMLVQAGVELEICETTHPLHAKERATEEDIGSYDGVVLMGGDGIIHEFLQGVHAHRNADQLVHTIKLGVIGCGTGNGLAKSLTHAANEAYSHLESTFLIAKSQTTAMDLSKYETSTQEYYSFLTFTWAMIADVDIESESVRFLGSLRFDLCAAWRVVSLRTYQARLSYLLPSKHDKSIDLGSAMPKFTDPVPNNWNVIDDTFILFWASQVTHASVNAFNSPPSTIGDGVFQILVIRGKWSRYQVALLLLALDAGTHVNSPAAEFIECVAYRLEPTTAGSFNDLDGEVIEAGPVQAHVLPKAIQIFCHGDS